MLHIRPRRAGLVAVAAGAVLLSLPAPTLADGYPQDGSVVLQVKADVALAGGTHRDTIIVIGGDATIQGEANTLVVVDGTATLTGARVGTLIVASGTADIGAGSTVDHVQVLDSVYHASPEAMVGTYETIQPAMIAAAVAPVALAVWLGFAIAYLLAGLVVAAIAGSQLRRAGASLTREPAAVAVSAVAVLIGLPLLVVLLAVTVIGIPAALLVAMMAIPLVWFIGSVAVAVRIGDWVLYELRGRVEASHPVVAAFIGLIGVGLISVIPILGFLVGLAGAGAVMLVGWRAAFGTRPTAVSQAPQPGPMAA
jgi:hypothetical protein